MSNDVDLCTEPENPAASASLVLPCPIREEKRISVQRLAAKLRVGLQAAVYVRLLDGAIRDAQTPADACMLAGQARTTEKQIRSLLANLEAS